MEKKLNVRLKKSFALDWLLLAVGFAAAVACACYFEGYTKLIGSVLCGAWFIFEFSTGRWRMAGGEMRYRFPMFFQSQSGWQSMREWIQPEFKEDVVEITYEMGVLTIPYEEIVEADWKQDGVSGGYSMRIKLKNRKFVFQALDTREDRTLTFEETDLGSFYGKLGEHGVKCC